MAHTLNKQSGKKIDRNTKLDYYEYEIVFIRRKKYVKRKRICF